MVGVDFTFNNSAGSATLLSSITQPGSWGRGPGTNLSTKDSSWQHSSSATPAGMLCWDGSVTVRAVRDLSTCPRRMLAR